MAASKKTGKAVAIAPAVGEFRLLKTSDLYGSPTNPRKTYHETDMTELVASVTVNGIINPVTVRPNGDHGTFEVVAGNRRYRAAILSGMLEVPCIVRDLTDDQVLEIQIDENLHRADVPPLEEAASFQQLIDLKKITVEELAGRVNKSAGYVYRRLKLNHLHPLYTEFAQSGDLPVTTAEIIAAYPHDVQEAIFKKTHYTESNGRVLFLDSKSIGNKLRLEACTDLSKAYFPTDRAGLQPGLQACTTCEKNTAVATLLFNEGVGEGNCTDKACWKIKEKVWMALALTEWEATCKQAGRKALYADIAYFMFEQKKDAVKILEYEPEVLGRHDYDIVTDDTPGAVPVMFVGANPWDSDLVKLSYNTGFVKVKPKREQGDWQTRQIMESDLTDEEKEQQLEQLKSERREAEDRKRERAVNEKWVGAILDAVTGKPLPPTLSSLKRLWLAHRLTDNHSRNIWLDVIGLEASDWKPLRFEQAYNRANHAEKEAAGWTADVQKAWDNLIEAGSGYDTESWDFWNGCSIVEKSALVGDALLSTKPERLDEMMCAVFLADISDIGHTDYNEAILSMFVGYAEDTGVSPYELKPDSLLATLGDDGDEADPFDFYADEDEGDYEYTGDGLEPENQD